MKKGKQRKVRLLILALVFLMVPIFWLIFGHARVTSLSKNFTYSADLVSIDNFYDEAEGIFEGATFSKSTFEYEAVASNDRVSEVENRFTVTTLDGVEIISLKREYGVDRLTGEHVTGTGDRNRQGYLFAPKRLKKNHDFTYWHVNYDAPAQMHFVDEERLFGLEVYKYESFYSGEVIDQTANLAHLPGVPETRGVTLDPHLSLWIEPETGMLVKYEDETTAYYYDIKTGERTVPWNRFSNTFTEASVREHVQIARTQKIISLISGVYLPILFFALAFWFLIAYFDYFERIRKKIALEQIYIISASAVTIVAGFVDLFGWKFNIERLVRYLPLDAAMNPMTAICFIAVALASLFLWKGKTFISMMIGAAVVTVGVLRLLAFYDVIPFDIDLIVLRNVVLAADFPSRMSAFTAFVFVLLGSAHVLHQMPFFRQIKASLVMVLMSLTSVLAVFLGNILYQFRATVWIGGFFESLSSATIIFFVVNAITMIIVVSSVTRRREEFRSIQVTVLALIVPIFTSVLIVGYVNQQLNVRSEAEFETEVQRVENLILNRFNVYIAALQGGVGLVAASELVEREEWKAYVGGLELLEEYPGIQGIGRAVFILPEEKAAHEAAIQAEGFPDYRIRPEGQREIYSSIIYLEPFDERNQAAFGFDMYQHPARRLGMKKAIETGEAQLAESVVLVQEIDEDVQKGLLIYLPVYKKGTAINTIDERYAATDGFVYGVFRVGDLMKGILARGEERRVALRIYDGIQTDENNLIYQSPTWNSNGDTLHEKTDVIYIAGRPWTIHYHNTELFDTSTDRKVIPLIVLFTGIVISFLIGVVFYALGSSREKAIDIANGLTKQLRTSRDKLVHENARSESIISSIGDGLCVMDKDGKVLLINDAFTTITGFTKKDVLKKKLTDVLKMRNENKRVPESKRLLVIAMKEGRDVKTTAKDNYYFIKKNGDQFAVSITVSPVVLGKKIVGTVEVFRDISKEKDIDKAKTEFVSLAAHQLRTPLAAISWFAELLTDSSKRLTKQQKEYIEEIVIGNKRMVGLVDALLNVSRLELGTFAITPEKIHPKKVVEEVLHEMDSIAKNAGIFVKSKVFKNVGEVDLDPGLYAIIVQNLVSNAIKYSPKGGHVKVSLMADKTDLILEVADDGYGIPKRQQKEVFNKLFRADNVRSKDTQGTGLGLYIVKSIVEVCGGSISFVSEEGKGTTFTVKIPLSGMNAREGEGKTMIG